MSNSEGDESDSDDYYGPALPPALQNKSQDNSSSAAVIGPSIPDSFKPKPSSTSSSTASSSVSVPPNKVSIGPALPPNFKPQDKTRDISPPPENESDSEDEMIGPLPPDHPKMLELSRRQTSSRGDDSDKPKKKLQREEWMLIPPSNKPVTELGLGPRKFLTRAPEEPVKEGDDALDSDEEFEIQARAAMDQKIIDEYDKKMEAMIDKSAGGKRKTETLLEIHQKDLKKKAKAAAEAAEKKERKPFDRNTDLAVSSLSGDDKKKYIERSRELGSRFHKGRQKFL